MGLPYMSVTCGRTDLRRVELLPPDRELHYLSPVERRFKGQILFFCFLFL